LVAWAMEEVAIRGALAGNYSAREGQAREVKVWQT